MSRNGRDDMMERKTGRALVCGVERRRTLCDHGKRLLGL
jgi:hypothetical protein